MKKEKDVAELEIVNISDEKTKSQPYMAKFLKAKTFNSSRQDRYAELMAFYQGNQHLLKNYVNDKPWVVNMNTPYATIAIDNRIASILANDYIGELLPLSPEDIDTIGSLEKLYKKEWERMNIDQRVRESIQGAGVVREFYVHIYLDSKKVIGGTNNKRLGALDSYCIEPGAVYIDPEARKMKDANYVFVTSRTNKTEVKINYPKYYELICSGEISTPEDRGENYIDNDYTTEQDGVYTKYTGYFRKDGKIERVIIINSIIVDTKMLELTQFPIAQFRWKKAAQSCYGLSLMDDVLSLQKAICSIESAITNTAIAYAAPSMMVRRGCGLDPKVVSKAIGAPGVIYAVDGDLNNAMKAVIPPQVNDSILNIKTDFENKIDKITGNTQQFLGNLGTAGNTSGGAKTAVERAKIIETNVLNNISEFVEDISNILIEYIVYLYAGETINVLDNKKVDGKFNFSKIDVPEKDKLDGAQYKYYIELETKTPYSRERQKELLMEIFQFERQYDTPIKTITVGDIIKNSGLENKDEIIDRFNNLTSQDATTKAGVIQKLIESANQFGIEGDLVSNAIGEIIAGNKETPYLDELMAEFEKNMQMQMQQNQQNLDIAASQSLQTPQNQALIQQMAIDQGAPAVEIPSNNV